MFSAVTAGSAVTETKLTLMYQVESETGPITGIEARVDGRPATVLADFPNYRSERRQLVGQMTVEIPPQNATVSVIARNEHGASEPGDFVVNWTGGKDFYKPNLYVLAVGVFGGENQGLTTNKIVWTFYRGRVGRWISAC